jgi:phage gp29-like protein
MLVENRVKEIFTVINNDLIPHLFRLNGWDENKTPKLKYGKLREIPFAEFAKAMQQLKATNLIAKTPRNINFISEQVCLPDRLDETMSMNELNAILGTDDSMQSRASDGYSSNTGGLNGTGDNASTLDNTANNLSNK